MLSDVCCKVSKLYKGWRGIITFHVYAYLKFSYSEFNGLHSVIAQDGNKKSKYSEVQRIWTRDNFLYTYAKYR